MGKKVEVSYNPQLGYLQTIFHHNFDFLTGIKSYTERTDGVVLAQLLQGVTYMTMYYSCAVYISTCVYEKYQTKGQSILNVVQLGLGAIVGNLVGGKLIRLLGYEKGYLLMAGITTLMTICALIVYFWKNREQRNGGDVCEI